MLRSVVFMQAASLCLSSGSSGCGKDSPYTPGNSKQAKGTFAGKEHTYRVYVPKAYNKDTPMPLIVQLAGEGVDAQTEEKGAGIALYADARGFISVTVQGTPKSTNHNRGGPWYSWNAVGTTQSPGPGGPTCTGIGPTPTGTGSHKYCHSPCAQCRGPLECSWTACSGDVVFIDSLYNTLEDQLCVDTTREYAAGESDGGIMTYQLGVDLAHRLAAIAPQFGSFLQGFNMAPKNGVPVLDLHGSKDTAVPANTSLSANGYYYTPVQDIFDGGKNCSGWKQSNGCSGPAYHYPTKYDGQDELYCVSEGTCSGGDVVRCAWNGGHNWLFNDASANGGLVTEFLLKWSKPSRRLNQDGDAGPRRLLEDVRLLDDSQELQDPPGRRLTSSDMFV